MIQKYYNVKFIIYLFYFYYLIATLSKYNVINHKFVLILFVLDIYFVRRWFLDKLVFRYVGCYLGMVADPGRKFLLEYSLFFVIKGTFFINLCK
jgi:hypothetical protein